MTKGTDPSGLEVWVTPPGRESRLLREEETEWVAQEVVINTTYGHTAS